MFLATPRPPNLNNSVYSTNCPSSSPPPVFSLTSAFFQSPFSVSSNPLHKNNKPTQQFNRNTSSSSSTPRETVLPSLCTGIDLQKLINEENADQETKSELDWRTSREWTPLSSRSSRLTQPQQTSAQPEEDRLDRLLAEIETISSPSSNLSLNSPQPSSSTTECWELPSLETRFQPIHTSAHSRPLRPCLKTRSTSVSSASSHTRSSASDSDSTPDSQLSDPPFEIFDLNSSPLELDDDRTVRVRFDDDTVEEFLTWSRESYDRKGPLPITKLNVREVIELKLIKEELGILPSVAISTTTSSCSSSFHLLPSVDPHTPQVSQ